MKTIAKKTFTADMIRHGSWGGNDIGRYFSTMEVYADQYGVPVAIEWDVPSLEETEHIGLEVEGMNVVGYDGIMAIPDEAIQMLEELGYNCDEIK